MMNNKGRMIILSCAMYNIDIQVTLTRYLGNLHFKRDVNDSKLLYRYLLN